MSFITEAEIEAMLLEQLAGLGYDSTTDAVIGPDGSASEREAFSEVLLLGRLEAAIARLNPDIPEEARADALKQVVATASPSLIEENRRLHRLMVEGVPVEFYTQDGSLRGDSVRLIDFADPDANDWLAVGQLTVVENGIKRRPDVVLFLNGLPVAVFELKNPGGEQATLTGAFNQLQTYKAQIPSLFRTNAALVISDGLNARIGSLTANAERFMPWRTVDGRTIEPKGRAEQAVLVEGVFERARFLALLRDFTVFGNGGNGIFKILAGYHQFHAVRRAMLSTLRAIAAREGGATEAADALREDPEDYGLPSVRDYRLGDRRIGVIWHTQGSGKSLLMAFYAGQLVRSPELANPTILVITDRNDLDDQLFGTFAMCADLIRQTPIQIEDREHLRTALDRASGGVIFTTMQKFAPPTGETAYPLLTDRRNVVVIADEAHRSQYGFKAKVDRKTGEISYGFAKYLRDALPNASFIGFTGTPIDQADVNTRQVFGDYIDVYDISRAVEDGATVTIYYESRLARIELPENAKPTIDDEIADLTEDEAESEQERIKRKWSTVEALVGAEQRLAMVAEDLVQHFEDRVAALDGKAMVVCMSRRICVALYDAIVAQRPDWHSDEDGAGRIKVVMTGSAADPQAWQPHIGTKTRRDLLAKRAKDPSDPLQLVIVRDMWLTGFDAPSMHTMYVDKPMRGHGLMQAIARVNRVFRDKPAGLVVDYIGIAQNLKRALAEYSAADQGQTGIDEAEAVAVLQEKYEVVAAMFHGFDFQRGLMGSPQERLAIMAEAIEWILQRQHEAAEREKTPEDKKRAHRRFQDATLALSNAFALAGASDYAREIRDAVGFFQTIRAALVKTGVGAGKSSAERDAAIAQIIDRSLVSTEIVDILAAAGLNTPDISILSDDFLAELAQMEKKNLALEALRKLLNDEVRSRTKTNVVQGKQFSERLEDAIARYHTNAITTVEILQELIALAKDIRAARARGEAEGLSEDEIAFYDALAENQSAVEVMGDDHLKVIAHELLTGLQGNVTVDWARRESARARMRVLVKRILRKYGYPPDLQDAAVQTVLAQAEALSASWTL
ncbi:type I restriction endonuclease subunit R [Imhoffiella purpurea]|uniref:Type I restriction enzyme endonuclease subunit n=1 Tax=Imhoffiella purpurea TaxID=1249627 RepID=W9VAK9_9GAMM|nr:type I restriction endonuclease subunit R [Imhoffiella purpurea]EXJ13936.1 Type I restriction-modification system, restriction subunit R [Imhoffiella purpurea]